MDHRFTRRALVRGILFGIASMALAGCGGSSSSRPEAGGSPPCTPLANGGAQPPRVIHASWTDQVHRSRTLTWFTDGSSDPGTLVEYGPVTDGMSACELDTAPFPFRALGRSHATYGVEAVTHVATLTGLQAGQRIRYRVGSEDGGWSAVQVLRPTHEERVRFCHFGDQGLGSASERVMRGVLAEDPDFYIIAGDIAYADGDQPLWDQYFDFQQPYAAAIPMMTCPGNHENNDGLGKGYQSRFSQPGRNTYYGFDYNRVHFFFSTGGSLLTSVGTGWLLTEELQAMENDLADAYQRRQDGEIDFIVVVQHYPIWTNTEGRSPGNPMLMLFQEGMLKRYEVDLLLAGHHHLYERSVPMLGGKAKDGGYVQLTQGGGGRKLYKLIDKPKPWAEVLRVCHGYSVLEVENREIRVRSYAVSDAERNLMADGEQQLIDEFVIPARVASVASAGRLLRAQSLPERRLPRRIEELDVDMDQMVRDTLERNLLHAMEENH